MGTRADMYIIHGVLKLVAVAGIDRTRARQILRDVFLVLSQSNILVVLVGFPGWLFQLNFVALTESALLYDHVS